MKRESKNLMTVRKFKKKAGKEMIPIPKEVEQEDQM